MTLQTSSDLRPHALYNMGSSKVTIDLPLLIFQRRCKTCFYDFIHLRQTNAFTHTTYIFNGTVKQSFIY